MSDDIVILPNIADLKAEGLLGRDQRPKLLHASITISPATNTLVLKDERREPTPVIVPLDEVAGIVRAFWQIGDRRDASFGKVVILDRSGHTLAQTRVRNTPALKLIWSRDVLAASGLLRDDEQFRTTRALSKAHPGTITYWALTTSSWAALFIVIALMTILILSLVAVGLTGS